MSYTYDYPMQSVTADVIVFHVDEDHKAKVLLTKRNIKPFKGKYALPGGHLDEKDWDVEETAHRELFEEVGIQYDSIDIEASGFVGMYSEKDRDPRGRYVSAAYYFVVRELPELKIDEHEVQSAKWVNVEKILKHKLKLAFDHQEILEAAIRKMQHKMYGGPTLEEATKSLIRAMEKESNMKIKCNCMADIVSSLHTGPIT